MGNSKKSRRVQRARRHRRIRKKIQGTAERPRLVVFRSLKNIEGQLVDDETSRTVVGVSTLAEELRGFKGDSQTPRVEIAFQAGKLLADKAKAAGVESVVFDRAGYKYHGRVKAFAEGARKGGLEF
ncbi:MAG: 50S ribosomal protein L18 [Gemmatimonadetes bacterium]|nr:50S ribosomal protein L18 [Gemmatimonadota bacterium]NNM03873.1 50S ribosomal protein L18 [Gemmatimonadota bacterium]